MMRLCGKEGMVKHLRSRGVGTVNGHLWVQTYLVRDRTTHASDKNDATAVPEASHLPPGRLRSKQHAVHIHIHDLHLAD